MDFNSLRKKYEGYSDSEILGAIQATKYPEYSLDEVKKAVGYQPPKRSFFAAANDTVIEAANAAAGFVKSAGDFVSPGNAASRFIDEKIIKPGEDSQSDVVKEEKARYAQEMQQAQGAWDEVKATGRYAINNPVLTTAQAVGSFAGPGMAVKGAGAVARAAGMGASGVTGAGMAGGSVAGAAGAGGDAAGTAYELVLKAGGTEEEATAAARQASIIPAVIGGAGGLIGAERVFAGGKGPAGSLMTRALKTGAVEGIQEGVEEGVTQYEGQRAAMPYDPTIDPMKGVAGAATMGAILGGGTGAGVSLLTKEQARADKFNAGMDKIATAQTVSEMVEGMQSANDPMDIAPLPTGLDAEGAIARMEAQMADDYKAIRAVGRSKFYGEQTQPVTDPLAGFNAPGEGPQATEPATQEVPQEPFNDRILTLRGHIEQSRVRQQVRDTLGPEALNDLLYYVGKADDASLPGKTSDRMLSLAEAILSRAQAQPIESRGLVGTDKKPEAPRLGANAPLPQIGLDATPTGAIRVDAAGNAAPEVRADQISLQDRARAMREQRDGLTAQAPKPKRDFSMVGDGVMQSASWVDVKRELGLPANATQADVLYAASQQDVKSIAWSKPTGETQTIAVPQKVETPNDQGSTAQENKGEASLPVEEATTTDGGAYEGQKEKRLLRPAPLIEAPGQGEAIVAKQTPAQTTEKPTLKERAAKLRAPKVEEPADSANEVPESQSASGLRIYQINIKNRETGAIERKWAVQTPENAERAKRGEREIGGDSIVESPEKAQTEAAFLRRRFDDEQKRKAVADAEEATRKASEAARKEANKGKSIAERSADVALSREIRDGGEIITRRQWVERKVQQGLKPTATQEDRIKPMSRAQFNRANNEEQRAHERKIKEAGKKDVYLIGDYEVTKTEYKYATSLLNAEQPPATPVAESQAPAPEAGDGAVARTQEDEGAAPMYASRPLTQASADAIRKWAASQGFKTTLPAADMHVTVAYSRTPMNGAAVPATTDRLIAESGKRTVEPLGDEGAVVLKFDSQELQARWSTYRKAGASWDYENYTPHVTLTYDGAGVDLAGVEPFDGPIEMAAEKQEPLNVDKAADYKDAGEAPTSKEAPPKPEQPAPKTLKQRAEEMKAKPAQEKIDDFGQKLAGARKDYAATLKDAEAVDIAAEPLSKSWPEPDYDKLLSGGADPYMVAFIHAARDELPTKPQKSWKLKGWVQQAELLRGISSKLLSGNISSARVKEMLGSPQFATLERHIGSRTELYELVGHSKSLKGITFAEHQYHLYKGQSNVRKWVVEQKAKATMFSNWPRELAVADTKQEMLDQFAAKLIAEQIGNGDGKKAPNKGKFSIYRKRGQEGAFVGKKIGREYIDLKKVADVAAARKYLDENTAELEAALAKYKETPFERNAENQPRVGDDHRNGAQVTPAIFSETFGFRGVQFGNYVEQDRRQSDLNQAFDGLMDLAAVLGIPPRALSLNGKLGLAFGARGKGGRNAPAAHYEPGSVVVNLTKNSGPGSLAHEWWHAADNYFGKQDGEGGFGTDRVLKGDTREAMREAFKLVKKETQQPSLRRRAFELDKRKSKPYWDTPIELSARSFESYVIAKLKDQGAANDYLANVVSKEFWDAQEALRLGFDAEPGKPVETYPYPTPDEVPAVRAAFDNFFQVVETKADDAGNVAMFNSKDRAQTNTPEFKRWFGDSKVVDAEGLPLVVYHGTGDSFDTFDPAKIGGNYRWSKGFYFAATPEAASEYAMSATDASPAQRGIPGVFAGSPADTGRGGANVMPVYLAMSNPLVRTARGDMSPDQSTDRNIEKWMAEARANGNDGLIVKPGAAFGDRGPIYIAFRPEQIKSATGNTGAFDPANPDIRFNSGEEQRYDATYESEPDTSPEALARTDDLAFGVEQDARGVGAAEALPYEPRRIRDGEGINDIAAAFGTDIQWFGLKPDLLADEKKQFGFFNGAYYNNTLFLAAEGVDRPHLAVLGHELGHRLAKTNPALYKKLVDAIRPYINQDTYGANFRNESVAQGVKTTDGLREEFIGEVISDGFMEKNFWRAAGDANPSLLRRVFTMVAEMIESIRTAIGVNRRTEKYLTDFDRVMQIAGEVMGEYGLSKADIKAAMGPVAYQRVWHGSPHRFEKFSTDAIGTGEGAQAYGHGLYFTGRKEIAEWYREKLSNDGEVRVRGELLPEQHSMFAAQIRNIADSIKDGKTFDEAREQAIGDMKFRVDYSRRNGYAEDEVEARTAVDALKALGKKDWTTKTGQLYEVDIPEDGEMLHWDKPLSEQPAKVLDATGRVLERVIEQGDAAATSRDLSNALRPYKRGDLAAEMAQRYGWEARGERLFKKDGTEVDEAAMAAQLAQRAGQKNYKDFGHVYRDMAAAMGSDAAVSEMLRAEGVAGIKYLDGTSRSAGEGSYNYVIFSDEDASIAGVAFNTKDDTPTVANIQAMVDQSTAEWKNGPKGGVTVVPNSAALPLNLRAADRAGDARAWFDPKTESVYLVADRLGSVAEAQFAMFHEVYGHYGMGLLFGQDYQAEMADLRAKNANVASAASMWFAKNSKPEIEARMARGMSMKDASIEVRALATEEALADMAGRNEATGVVSDLLAKLQSALRTMGLDSVANWMEARTDAEVMAVLKKARDQVKGATRPHAFRDAVPMASRASAEGAARPQGQPSRTEQTRNIQQKMRQNMADMLGSAGAKVSWWDKTVGTQYAKAEKFPELKRVFDKVQQYIEDVSTMANESADKAKSILPKLESWKDLKNFGISDDDAKAIAGPIFTGTLTDKKVYSDADLRSQYSLNDKQIGQYRDFMAAVNVSLDQAATADVLRLIGDKNPALRELALTDRDTFKRGVQEYLSTQARDAGEDAMASDGDAGEWTSLQRKVAEKYASIEKLKSEGYAPLMRFGQYKVHIANEQGETLFFGLYETRADANRMARELAQDPEFAGAVIERGVLSQEQYKLFSGLPLDSLEMFANAIGAEQSEVFQEFIKLAKNNRSAMKRLIHRKGTAGFSEDVPRVLAAFITSNARMASSGMNLPSAKEAAQDIRAGDVQDEAIKLIEAVQNPGDTAGVFRGLMFVNFIGGSIASAVVNLTQPITMTLPYLSQWGGAAKAASRLMRAGKMAASGKIDDLALRAALLRAENDGIVSPQEIHFLTSQAMGSFGSNPIAQRAAFIWSAPFSLAEQLNRRSSFIAAYMTAKESGITDAFEFAEKAVIETQGLYNKGNAPNWARNPIGASALTFKQFSVHYLEWMGRMYRSGPEGKKAVLLAIALLMLFSGTDGLPGADDIDDLVDTLGQALGFDTNFKKSRRDFIAKELGFGDEFADIMARGASAVPGVPMDVSLRMSMGNLLPATGLLLRSNTDKSRDVLELAGPAGGLLKQYSEAAQKALAGQFGAAALGAMPVAIQNAAKGVGMWESGEARDTLGRKVMDADATDGLMKFLGFQPQAIARESEKLSMIRRSEQLAKNVEGEIVSRWARAQADGDTESVAQAREDLREWNENNPDQPIIIKGSQIMQRVRKLRQDRAQRFITTISPERRRAVEDAIQ